MCDKTKTKWQANLSIISINRVTSHDTIKLVYVRLARDASESRGCVALYVYDAASKLYKLMTKVALSMHRVILTRWRLIDLLYNNVDRQLFDYRYVWVYSVVLVQYSRKRVE